MVAPRLGPARQHRHGRRRARDRRPGRGDGGVRCRRRHLHRLAVGGVLARLVDRGVRRPGRSLGGDRATTTTGRSSAATSPTAAGPCSTERSSRVRGASGCSGCPTRARAGSAPGATRPGSASTRSAPSSRTRPAPPTRRASRSTRSWCTTPTWPTRRWSAGCVDLVLGGPSAQPVGSDAGHGGERRDGLQLHHGHDRRGGVRVRPREHDQADRPGHAGHLRRGRHAGRASSPSCSSRADSSRSATSSPWSTDWRAGVLGALLTRLLSLD